jgi:2-polyprenyl-6-methoxyphenol hydroxylase-like FAD-dependent oxidoreductase
MASKLTALVAGAGPVGLTMAAELARHGVSCRIIDKAPARTALSKALVVWPRTLELLRFAGVAKDFLEAGRKINSARLYAGKRKIAQMSFEGIETSFPFALFVPQSETERLLEEHLRGLGVKVERNLELFDFTASVEGVIARLRRADGKSESVLADYLLGCDGAHSMVRHKLGFPFEGVSEQGIWMLADVRIRSHPQPGEMLLFWHEQGVLAIFPMNEGRYRVIANWDAGAVLPEEDAPASLAQIQHFLDRRGPGKMVAFEPSWITFFRINERKVKEYRQGRVFLLGDAAHIHSPAGGQGMNTGMQDAFNLAWKMALATKTKGGASALLETYSGERSAVGDTVLKNAARLTYVATIRSTPVRIARNITAWALMKTQKFRRRFAAVLTELDISYPDSALSKRTEGALPGPIEPGMRAPDADLVLLGGGRSRLYDALDPSGFTLLSSGADEAPTRAMVKRFAPYVKFIPCLPGRDYVNGFYVIRPDGYIGLIAGMNDVAQVEAYLREWLRGKA